MVDDNLYTYLSCNKLHSAVGEFILSKEHLDRARVGRSKLSLHLIDSKDDGNFLYK